MKRGDILDVAKRAVCGDRDEQYGNPHGSFAEIAVRWSHYLSEILDRPIGLTEHDVAMMMVEFKMARLTTSKGKSEDSYVDACGYLSIASELFDIENKVANNDIRTDN